MRASLRKEILPAVNHLPTEMMIIEKELHLVCSWWYQFLNNTVTVYDSEAKEP